MKISTNLFFQRASQQLVTSQDRLAELQLQLGTGKKINNASDAPDKASALQRLRSLMSEQESHLGNLNLVNERLKTQDVALTSTSDLLQRLRELAVQYSNGTLGADQRKIAAVEVRGIRDQILTLANSPDSSGMALFAGSRVEGKAFTEDGGYIGDQTRAGAPVGFSRLVDTHRAGDEVFAGLIRKGSGGQPDVAVGFFKVIDDLATGLEENDLQATRRGIDELGLIHQGISMAHADIGSDMNLAQSQETVLQEQLLQMKSLQSDLEDVDYAKAVSELQKQMLGLEAAQSSFAKISGLSLFQYL